MVIKTFFGNYIGTQVPASLPITTLLTNNAIGVFLKKSVHITNHPEMRVRNEKEGA